MHFDLNTALHSFAWPFAQAKLCKRKTRDAKYNFFNVDLKKFNQNNPRKVWKVLTPEYTITNSFLGPQAMQCHLWFVLIRLMNNLEIFYRRVLSIALI